MLAVTAFLVGSLAVFASPAPRLGFQVEPSKTWVGIARVHLEIDDLWLSGDELAGAYRIRVPLSPSRSDAGTLRLRLSDTVERLRGSGGTLVGNARSDRSDKLHDVVCTVSNSGKIRIDVHMDDRVLSFKSRYATLSDRPGQSAGDS